MSEVQSPSQVARAPFAWQFPVRAGHALTLYTVGDEAFEAAYQAIRQATKRVWLETYIFEPDEVGNTARDALVEAAERGCDVILLFDRWGSPKIGGEYAQPIIDAGGRVVVFNPALPWRKLGRKLAPILHRDHRKILITDDVGFCGGANVSRDYGGPGPELFFDLTIRVEGPSVRDFGAIILDSVLDASGSAPPLFPMPDPPHHPHLADVQVLALNRRKKQRDLDRAIYEAIRKSSQRCYLMTPYFVPSDWFIGLLTEAAARGVDVRILTAGKSDVPLTRVAGRHLYGRLLRAGIRVYEMMDPVLHAKGITVDGRYSVVGSYNVDAYGGKYNLEVGIGVDDVGLARRLEDVFDGLIAEAGIVRLDDWTHRAIHRRVIQWALFHAFRF